MAKSNNSLASIRWESGGLPKYTILNCCFKFSLGLSKFFFLKLATRFSSFRFLAFVKWYKYEWECLQNVILIQLRTCRDFFIMVYRELDMNMSAFMLHTMNRQNCKTLGSNFHYGTGTTYCLPPPCHLSREFFVPFPVQIQSFYPPRPHYCYLPWQQRQNNH